MILCLIFHKSDYISNIYNYNSYLFSALHFSLDKIGLITSDIIFSTLASASLLIIYLLISSRSLLLLSKPLTSAKRTAFALSSLLAFSSSTLILFCIHNLRIVPRNITPCIVLQLVVISYISRFIYISKKSIYFLLFFFLSHCM